MAKYYSLDKAIDTFLSFDRLYKFSMFARSNSGLPLDVVTNTDKSCYTHRDFWYGNTNIVLGRGFYPAIFELPDKVDVLDIKERYKHMATCYVGVFYHEFFHVMYTDMEYAQKMYRRMDSSFSDFAHNIVNILEDVTIEGSGMINYPYSKEYLATLNQAHIRPETVKSVAELIETSPDNPGTLLSFLLLLARGYDVSTLPTYNLYEDNKEFIKWGAYKCINTVNARMRFNRQIAYAKQLINILDMKPIDKTEIEEGDGIDTSDVSGPSKPTSKKAEDVLRPTNAMDQYDNDNSEIKNNPQNTVEDLVDSDLKKDMRQDKAERGTPAIDNEGHSGFDQTDLTKEAITTLCNDEPILRYTHRASRIDRYKNTSNYTAQYQAVVQRYEQQIRKVVAQIRRMKGENNTSWNRYQMKGKFDVTSTLKRGNFKFFKTKNAPSREADLVFEILVDNSGSMSGKKSKLAGEALIIFAEALHRLHIPFAVDAFTEGHDCITIKLKEFNDSYAKVKTNMTLLTEQYDVDKLATFCGNIDEVNLRYVRDILKQQRQQDKVCIVISDGATCGSWKDLKKVADGMEKDGITVLGIGVFDDNVQKIYTNNLVLKTQQDLEGLGAFLNKYLVRKIFK